MLHLHLYVHLMASLYVRLDLEPRSALPQGWK